ncbi:MAG: NYN domain-containing protein [archaeon]|nr:NYN domain-containing protein [archaeon]
MRVIIFNDKQNFDGSLNLLNKRFEKKQKRFWNYEKYIPFLIDKIKSFDRFKKSELQLTKTFFYSGRYNSNLISKVKWNCHQQIAELNSLIKKEQDLLNYISQQKISHEVRKRTNKHVENIKNIFEKRKEFYLSNIEKQKRNFEGQKELFEKIKGNPFIEIKTTPLKQRNGDVYQKGVDVMIATDLVNLAHTDTYDIALILGGDTDLIECIKLIKSLGKIAIMAAFYTPGEPLLSTISDLVPIADHFINLNELSNKEILAISDILIKDK